VLDRNDFHQFLPRHEESGTPVKYGIVRGLIFSLLGEDLDMGASLAYDTGGSNKVQEGFKKPKKALWTEGTEASVSKNKGPSEVRYRTCTIQALASLLLGRPDKGPHVDKGEAGIQRKLSQLTKKGAERSERGLKTRRLFAGQQRGDTRGSQGDVKEGTAYTERWSGHFPNNAGDLPL